MERRLFDEAEEQEGYYLDNGASLCPQCHIKAEQTLLSCEEIRLAANIQKVVLPSHLYTENAYDKWGNIILHDGRRLRGELFYDPSVQKILRSGGVMDTFCKYVKYPRTHFLPWGRKSTDDDRILSSVKHFEGRRVVVTPKMDGENTTCYDDYIHARSIDGQSHPSQSWVKNLHAKIGYNIPAGWRVCGENLYAKHTIAYNHLDTYFYVFSIWDDNNECLSWEETIEWAKLLDLQLMPVLYDGIWDESIIRNICPDTFNGDPCEGYVVRVWDRFSYSQFRKSVAKYVKPEFSEKLSEGASHWRYKRVVVNQLREV
jgi:hypothetical protein